jgi:hypothetical protein
MRGKCVVVVVALSACTSHGKKTIRIDEHEAAPARVSVDKRAVEERRVKPKKERGPCLCISHGDDPLGPL